MLPYQEQKLERVIQTLLLIVEKLGIDVDMSQIEDAETKKQELETGVQINEEIKIAKESVAAKYATQLASAPDTVTRKQIIEQQALEAKAEEQRIISEYNQ